MNYVNSKNKLQTSSKISLFFSKHIQLFNWSQVWNISLLKSENFQLFSLWVKKISLGQVKKFLGQRRVSLSFPAGQKYARVRSGQGPSLFSPKVSLNNQILNLKYYFINLWFKFTGIDHSVNPQWLDPIFPSTFNQCFANISFKGNCLKK